MGGDETRTLTAREHRTSGAAIGTHILADLWYCTYDEGADCLLPLAVAAAQAANAKVLTTAVHEFSPGGGTTVLLLLAESHLSLHTWPEYGYVAVDLFTCGVDMRPHGAIDYLEQALRPSRKRIQVIERGREDG